MCSVNGITTFEPFGACHKLRELYVRRNSIADLTEIRHLRSLPELRILWLSENPCATSDQYRLTVIRNLPRLELLDNMRVTDEERAAATECIVYELDGDSGNSDLAEHVLHDDDKTGVDNPQDLAEQAVEGSPDECNEAGEAQVVEACSNDEEEEVDQSTYWQEVASVADRILLRPESQNGYLEPEQSEAVEASEAPPSQPCDVAVNVNVNVNGNHVRSHAERPVSRKHVSTRKEAKITDAVLSLLEIVDDRAALERIRQVVDERLNAMVEPGQLELANGRDHFVLDENDENDPEVETEVNPAPIYV